MTEGNKKDMRKEYNNFLTACHKLKFSKVNENSQETVDIERRCLALKCLTANMMGFENLAACLLERGLETYQALMDSADGLNNYWNEIHTQISNNDTESIKWKSGLNDLQDALDFIDCLSCQEDKTLPCNEEIIKDNHVRAIVDTWKTQETSERKRKSNVRIKPNFRLGMVDEDRGQKGYRNIKNETDEVPLTCGFKNKNNSLEIHKSGESQNPENKFQSFKTARDELGLQQMTNNKQVHKKTLGGKISINSQFVCPFKRDKEKVVQTQENTEQLNCTADAQDERLKNIDPKMIELIKNEIMDLKTTISWNDIAGLEFAKKIIQEVIVFPMLRPDIFTGLRRPPKGILLFGPPGTGKTLIGKCIAAQSKSTFFSISASSLTSKWIGEGEKMVRALFAVARVHQPSVVFIDEIDSLLSQRSETEHESSRRLKTEFLVQLDGAATSEEDSILIVGATNRPQELDEAARRRLVKRLYIPLPELEARKQIINNLLVSVPNDLTQEEIINVANEAKGYSGADMTNLCKEASMEPIRSIPFSELENIKTNEIRPVTVNDFKNALANVRSSVSQSDLSVYIEWDRIYGSGYAQCQNMT